MSKLITYCFLAGLLFSCKKELNEGNGKYDATFYCDEGLNCNVVDQVKITFEYITDDQLQATELESNTVSVLSLRKNEIKGSLWVSDEYWTTPQIIGQLIKKKDKVNIVGRYSALNVGGDWVSGDFEIKEQ